METLQKTKQDGLWVEYVLSLMPEKKIIKLCSASRMTFQLGFTEQIPKILEENLEHFRAFRETLFEREWTQKALKYNSERIVSGLFLRNEYQYIPWQLRF